MRLKKGDVVFHNWIIDEVIGGGSFGVVYAISREELGRTYRAAAKVISIPGERKGIHETEEGMTENNVLEYYRSQMEAIVEECVFMERMKGDSHIVSYEDHYVEQKKDGRGFTIYIRMELLTPFVSLMQDEKKKLGAKETVKLGIDLCRGLSTCQKFQVVHRDIKTENIFVSETGNYKLGDFGISKTMQESELAISKKGSQLYMAPEIFRGEKYDATVDIYSLGIVLYRLMNHNRIPFLPPYPETIYYNDKKNALYRRLSGERLPKPCDADEDFSEIILKAASYIRKKRYQTAEEMQKALEKLLEKYEHPEIKTVKDRWKSRKTLLVEFALVIVVSLAGVFIYKNVEKDKEYYPVVRESFPLGESLSENVLRLNEKGEEVIRLIEEEKYLTCPETVGLTEEEAVELLTLAGYETGVIKVLYEYDENVQKGLVMEQSIEKGSKALKKAGITVKVSMGAKPKPKNAPKDNPKNEDDSDWIWKAL